MAGVPEENTEEIEAYLSSIAPADKQAQARQLASLVEEAAGELRPRLWNRSMIGFGVYHYRYDSGREGHFFLTGMSSRSKAFSVYLLSGFDPFEAELQRLGQFSLGKSCLYIKSLEDVDKTLLSQMVRDSISHVKAACLSWTP